MDEHKGTFRIVTTIYSYTYSDGQSGDMVWRSIIDSKQYNALYTIDLNLNIIGKIENLAPDERVYSVRFLGDTGYFVTFRQVDPLFAVDLSDPANPVILSALKIPGFRNTFTICRRPALRAWQGRRRGKRQAGFLSSLCSIFLTR